MKYVRDVLQKKGYDIWSVAPTPRSTKPFS